MAHWRKIRPASRFDILAILIFCASAVLATMALIHRHEHVERRDSHRPPTADLKSGGLVVLAAWPGTRSMLPPAGPPWFEQEQVADMSCYSIAASARSRNVSGIMTPIAFAALGLTAHCAYSTRSGSSFLADADAPITNGVDADGEVVWS